MLKNALIKKQVSCEDCEFKIYCCWYSGVAYMEIGSREKKVGYLCSVMKILISINKMKKNGASKRECNCADKDN